MASIKERNDRAASRRGRLNSSRLTLDYPGLARIRGGGEPLSDTAVRDRIRALIHQGILSHEPPLKMFAGPSQSCRPCSLCGEDLAKGEVEFETTLPDDQVLFFHRRCADLWLVETKEAAG
jgi:hypothetical protein